MKYYKKIDKSTIKEYIKNLIFLPFIFFGLYPIIPEKWESYIPITLLVISFIFFVVSKKKKLKYKKQLLISVSIFFVFFVSCFYSENFDLGIKKIETMLSLLGIPIAILYFLINIEVNFDKLKKVFLKVFFFSNIFYSIIAIYQISIYNNEKYPYKDANFFRNALSDIPFIGEHPIYISLLLAIAFLFGFYLYKKSNSNLIENSVIAVGQIILLTLFILIMSRAVILGLVLAVIYLFLNKLFRFKAIVIAVSLLFIITIFIIPRANNRFNELFFIESFNEDVDKTSSTNIRFNIMRCNLELISKHPIIGYGLGDVQSELDLCYNEKGLKIKRGKYNSHNQYIFVWLSAGIIGFFVFIFFIIYWFWFASFFKDHLLQAILLIYSIVFLFENVLSRQTGVIVFTFVLNFLLACNLNKFNRNKLIKE